MPASAPTRAVDVRALARRLWESAEVEPRLSALRVRWHLRHAQVGAGAIIVGRPYVTTRNLHIGSNLLIFSQDRRVRLGGIGRIDIGDHVFLNAGAMVTAREQVTIGSHVALAYDVFVTDSHDHGLEGRPPVSAPVVIGDGAWVGARAIVLPGVTIGRRAVVGAGAIVTQDVPDDTLVVGQPARVVRQLHYPPGTLRAWTD
jgi:acetyltransferase-like isoleucine patch superfamily enzyme